MAADEIPRTLATLGLFVFELKSAPFQQLQRSRAWRHPSVSRVGRQPARQFLGAGDQSITLSGVLYPELTGGKASLEELATMADTGKAWPLLDGTGTLWGLFVIEDQQETYSEFFPDGTARKIEFTLKLGAVDDEDRAMLGNESQFSRG